ncbi:annexin A4-like [Lethenteron reissneri]|uniref:annexin A4-like n=1 Tax=Lethenteron reissneri TaxID=7753 RepID=UPI002AB62B9C|nr:annexin A4-like [Lethenteron reissneri]
MATLAICAEFDPAADAEKLRGAMKGFGTDETAIVEVATHRSNVQRQEIVTQFKAMYGKELLKDLKSELTGSLERLIVALFLPPPVFLVKQLKKAMKGLGTDEKCLIETLATRSNVEIQQLCQAYEEVVGRSLEDDIVAETAGYFKRVLVSLLTGNRDESPYVDEQVVMEDAQALFEAGEESLGTDESTFLSVLCSRSYPHLRRVFETYTELAGKDIEESIKGETSGSFEDALLAIVRCIRNKPAYFARRLNKALTGLSLDDVTLTRIVVSRCELDLLDIRSEFLHQTGVSLHSAITDAASGDYKRALLELCGSDDAGAEQLASQLPW